jgi:hypothetical protein
MLCQAIPHQDSDVSDPYPVRIYTHTCVCVHAHARAYTHIQHTYTLPHDLSVSIFSLRLTRQDASEQVVYPQQSTYDVQFVLHYSCLQLNVLFMYMHLVKDKGHVST